MRLPLPRPTLLAILALALSAASSAQYVTNSSSAQSQQRSLEKYGRELRDSIRSQRNTPSPRSNSESTSDWLNRMQAANEARDAARERNIEQARAEADWRRDHPNETPGQYYTRIQKEAEEILHRQALMRAEAQIKANEEFERQAWNRYNSEQPGFAARHRPPRFETLTAALNWYRAHNAQQPNVWAAVNAAVLLIDGLGTSPDIAAAAALVDPAIERGYDAKARARTEPSALFAYLQATHGGTHPALKNPDPQAPRRTLETLAPQSDLAKWYLARVLAESPDPADHKKALELLPAGHDWANTSVAEFLAYSPAGKSSVEGPLDATASHILERTATALPAALQTWPRKNIERFARTVLSAPKPFHAYALDCFAEAAAQRFIPDAPSQPFPYGSFEPLLSAACREGSSAADAIALLQLHHLIGVAPFTAKTPEWTIRVEPELALPALTRWATRPDTLGIRTRILLATLAAQTSRIDPVTAMQAEAYAVMLAHDKIYAARLADSRANLQTPSSATLAAIAAQAATVQAYSDAIARREASAPDIAAVPGLTAAVTTNVQLDRGLRQLHRIVLEPAAIALLYAVEDPSFDLAKAAARFAAAYAPGTSTPARRVALIEAIRLGDAIAPLALAHDYARYNDRSLMPAADKELRATSTARRARDEAARNPRALAARLIEARFEESDELKPVFTQAIAAGSILAPRAELSRRIDISMNRENDRPPSWELPPALIAELDAAVVEINARPDRFNEWSLFPLFLNDDETKRVAYWFQGFDLWEKDRQERLADAELIRVIQPQINAVIATLSDWPGLDPYNAQRAAQLDEAIKIGEKADKLVATDGTGALVLYLQAAGLGDRAALDRLAGHIRRGNGQLPRSAEFSARLTATTLKMIQGDAEVGDAYAASLLGSALISGRFIAKDRAAGLDWLRYAAGLGDRDAASKLAGESGEQGDKNPAESRHWSAVGEGIQFGEMLLAPPRRLQGAVIDLTPILPALETALTAAERRLAGSAAVKLSEADEAAIGLRYEKACTRLPTEPTTALVEIAQTVADGYPSAPFTLGQLLTGGRFGLHPALARRFHAIGLAHLKQEADRGDLHIAHRLGLHYLDLLEKPDPVAAVRWFTYSVELGNSTSASTLAEIYTHGAPGITPDPATAHRWQAIALEISSDQYLSAPARVISGSKTPLTALRAPLQRALEAARLASTKAPAVPEGDAAARKEAATVLFETDPPAALLALTRLAGEGRSTYAFDVADILSSGTANYGYGRAHFEPDRELARQFQTVGRALLVAEAERGDAEAACQIGRRLLNPVDEKPDIAAAIRWLSYAAELGNAGNAEELAQLYTTGAPGLPADPAAAARWTAFGEKIGDENFKPRAPLR